MSEFDTTHAALADACWQALAESDPHSISFAALAESCGLAETEARLIATDVTHLILHKLDALDEAALKTSFDDFEDDPQATIYEKLFEGLVMRFEMFSDHRPQIQRLHEASLRAPLLGLQLTHQLSDVMNKLLYLCGDTSEGFVRQARILGVTAVAMKVRPVWQADDSPDLGQTMKKLDEELKKACEWAVSLRVLSRDDVNIRAGDEA